MKFFQNPISNTIQEFHFVVLEITLNSIQGKTFQVCAESAKDEIDPRWRPKKHWWKSIHLPCEGSKPGVSEIDRFEIVNLGTGS